MVITPLNLIPIAPGIPTYLSIYSPIALNQAEWNFNYLTGNDTNSGSYAAPLKTWAEYVRRCGADRFWATGELLFRFHSDHPSIDPIYGTISPGPLARVIIRGDSLTVLHSGTMSSFRSPSHASNTQCGITEAGKTTWSGLTSKLLRLTSGSHSAQNAKACTLKDEGGGILRLGRITYQEDDYYNLSEFIPSGTETFEIVERRKIASLLIRTTHPTTGFGGGGITFIFENIKMPSTLDGDPARYDQPESTLAAWCEGSFWSFGEPYGAAFGCHFTGIWAVAAGSMVGYFNSVSAFVQSIGGIAAMGGTWSFQGAGAFSPGFFLNTAAINCHSASGGMEIYDSTTTIFVIDRFHLTILGRVSGKNNIGPAWKIKGGAEMIHNLQSGGFTFQSDTNASGVYGPGTYDFMLSGASTMVAVDDSTYTIITPARDLNYPNLIASTASGGFGGSVYHQKTSAKIVSGV